MHQPARLQRLPSDEDVFGAILSTAYWVILSTAYWVVLSTAYWVGALDTAHWVGALDTLCERPDSFDDKQSQIAERKTGYGWGPGDHSIEAVQ